MFDVDRSFIAAVEGSARAVAIVDGEQRLGYTEWYGEICRVIDGLADQGLRKGDHLAVIRQNRLAMASLHWAYQLAGFIVMPLNWRMKAEELEGQCYGRLRSSEDFREWSRLLTRNENRASAGDSSRRAKAPARRTRLLDASQCKDGPVFEPSLTSARSGRDRRKIATVRAGNRSLPRYRPHQLAGVRDPAVDNGVPRPERLCRCRRSCYRGFMRDPA
jgi:hypothetical protein